MNNSSEVDFARMRQPDLLPRMGAGCLVLLGATIVVIAVTSLFAPASLSLPGFVVYGLIGLGFAMSGIFWIRYISALEETRRLLFAEKEVLRAAERHTGRLTVALITLHTPLSSEEAEHVLDRLCRRGVAYPDVLDDGTIEYRFRGLIRE
jgi:hypothetical protein